MIEIRNLSHSLSDNTILENVNLTLPEGRVMGLVGINGAGKTTLLRLMAGVYSCRSGEILCDGENIKKESAREKIFFLPDDPYFTVHTTGKSLFDMYKVFYPSMEYSVFKNMISGFSLNEKKPLRNFSKGMRRQIYIALALSANPKYILLDEAFDGLDPLARISLKKAINEAVEQRGASVMISTHSLLEMEDFCDCYALLDNKTVTSSGDISDKINRFCKFQLAFSEEIPENTFWGLPVFSVEQSGRFVRIILEGDSDSMREALNKLSPAVLEEMPINFEEIFIHDVKKRGDII